MLAVKHSLTGALDRKVMYCIMCGAQYLADPGDYWDHPDDYIFTCCGTPMVLGKLELEELHTRRIRCEFQR